MTAGTDRVHRAESHFSRADPSSAFPHRQKPRRRGRRWLSALIFVFGLAHLPASAYSSYGLGNLECKVYLERRAKDQESGTMQSTSFIHAYLSGYLTAGNMMHGLVGDHAEDVAVNVHSVVQWLDAWCLEHGEQRVAVSLESFWVEAAAAKEKLRRSGGKLPAQ